MTAPPAWVTRPWRRGRRRSECDSARDVDRAVAEGGQAVSGEREDGLAEASGIQQIDWIGELRAVRQVVSPAPKLELPALFDRKGTDQSEIVIPEVGTANVDSAG